MSWMLQGPFPLDLGSVAGSMNTLLDGVERAAAGGDRSDARPAATAGQAPGLYALWRVEGERWALAGVWMVFGPTWLEGGPAGPPDRHPPYALEVLAALTEAVWWVNLPVWPREKGTWRPVIVLEWPAALASRSALPPPGVHAREDEADPADAGGSADGWLAPARGPGTARAVVEDERRDTTGDDTLPWSRSLVTVVRARLTHDGARHVANCRVAPRARLGEGGLAPLDAWIADATAAGEDAPEPDGPHTLGRPLELFGGRVGFPVSGWLTRTLGVWPPAPADLRPGALHARDVGRRWRAQALQAVVVLFAVTASVLAVGATIDVAAAPQLAAEYVAPAPPPQPALSVCSPDNEPFMRELRCQVAWFAGGGSPDVPVCGDEGADPALDPATAGDLQPAWCGLYDRALDGDFASVEKQWSWHELAAARACYNVLGSPYKYRAAGDASVAAHATGDPNLFLHDERLQVWDLVQLVGALDESCDDYRERVERQVEGAVLATLVGSDGDPAASPSARLRQLAVSRATEGLRQPEARCVEGGAADGVSTAEHYDGLCDPADPAHARAAARVAWARLGTDGTTETRSAVERYADARFGKAGPKPESSPTWRCHAQMAPRAGRAAERLAAWFLTVPDPVGFDVRGAGARNQLPLDAALTQLEAGPDAFGPCWSVVARALNRYAPAHPLLGALDANGWPSVSQQLCGQACAVRYGLRKPATAGDWVTAGADLAMCVDPSRPETAPTTAGDRFDRLRIPWNGGDDVAWTTPGEVDVCAFNLVAQGYFPGGDDGVIVGGITPQAWAGETALGSGIAGGPEGAAVTAAGNLSSYGRAHSVATCGHVATQCFATGFLSVVGDPKTEPYAWTNNWHAWLVRMSRDEPAEVDGVKETFSPWCSLVRPYLAIDGRLPEGQLEYPCAKGVDDTRVAMEKALGELAAGGWEAAQP